MGKRADEWVDALQPARNHLLEHPAIEEVRINAGMPMEYDPRKGETPKPTGLEFTIPNGDDLSVLKHISDACDRFGLRVVLPDFKQPNWEFRRRDGEVRTYNEHVDYDKFVRLVPDR